MTPLGDANPEGAPLEYHLRLLETYRDTLRAHAWRRRPATVSPARATPSSRSARSWTCWSRRAESARREAGVQDGSRKCRS